MALADPECLQLLASPPLRRKTLCVFLNCKAGGEHAQEELGKVRHAFAEAGLEADVRPLTGGEDLRRLAREALKERPPVLVAAGGDGTVSSLADMLRGTDTALGVLPFGTFNHFAKDLGIPLELAEAARVIAAGRSARVDVGEVNGSGFVNNVSLGIYPKIVQQRTQQQRRFGRSKRAAMLWATAAALQRPPLLELRLELDNRVREARAPFVFVGNNDYVMEGFGIGKRSRLDAGALNVYTTPRSSVGGLIGLALRALFGRLRQADDFLEASAGSLRVESPRRRLLVAVDGEVRLMDTPLDFRIRPRQLQVIVP